jgi:hypothetical protein
MSTSPSTPRSTEQACDPVRLASYLSLGVTGALMATATSEAAIVMIDLTNVNGQNITGANAGVANGSKRTISNWLGAGTGTLELYNGYVSGTETYWGLEGDDDLWFAFIAHDASPFNFVAGATIDGSANWTENVHQSGFKYDVFISPDFGDGSFMGFRFGSGSSWNYGYLEGTWNSSTDTFQILSGAYESTVNTSILAGATAPSGVPVPAASLLALMALGGNSFRRSRTRAA